MRSLRVIFHSPSLDQNLCLLQRVKDLSVQALVAQLPGRLMGEPLRDYRGVEYALLLPSAFDDHSIAIFNLGGINVVDLFAAVPLTDPLRRAVILNGHLSGAAPLTNRECRFVRTAPNHRTIPAGLLRGLFLGGSLLREHCRHQRKGKYRREQQREQLLQHVTTSLLTGTIVLCGTKMDESCDFSTALRSHLFQRSASGTAPRSCPAEP